MLFCCPVLLCPLEQSIKCVRSGRRTRGTSPLDHVNINPATGRARLMYSRAGARVAKLYLAHHLKAKQSKATQHRPRSLLPKRMQFLQWLASIA